jgi:predicted ferric reductase
MNYEPAESAFISVKGDRGMFAEHGPLAISSSPVSRDLRFSSVESGGFTRLVPCVAMKRSIEIFGPVGQFTPHRLGDFRRQVLIAGEIGITLFLGMLVFETAIYGSRKVWRIYAVRQAKNAFYDEEIRQQIAPACSPRRRFVRKCHRASRVVSEKPACR